MKNKIIILISIFIFVLSSCSKSKTDDNVANDTETSKYEITEAYKYPVVPETKEWAELGSLPDMIEATHVDPDMLEKMSTPALVETVVTYPLFVNVNAYQTLESGVEEVSEYFKGIEILCKRKDARKCVEKYINDRCPGLTEMESNEDISQALSKYEKAYNESGDREVFFITNAVTLINYLDLINK
jgi:hypothetical protein